MYITMIRTTILYFLIVFSLRVMGKKQIGELQPSELVVTILISNIATLPIENNTIPLIASVIPILLFVSYEVIMSFIELKSKRIRRLVTGTPRYIIKDGLVDIKEMKKLRFTIDDLMESLRQKDFFDINEINYAIVETSGKISILPKFVDQKLSNKSMNINGEDTSPHCVIISDGVVLKKALEENNLNQKWLNNTLNYEKLTEEDIFIMTANNKKSYFISKKEA